MYVTLNGEVALREEANRYHWTQIVNEVILQEDEDDRKNGLGNYNCTIHKLENHFEGENDMIWVARRRIAHNVWHGLMFTLLEL